MSARRVRGPLESLLAIVLGMEAAVLFFATLVAFGLRALEPAVALAGGGALLVVFVIVAGLQRYRAGVIAGAVLQLVIIATGVLVTAMYLIGAGFAAFWLWCYLRGRKLETTAAAAAAADHPTEGNRP